VRALWLALSMIAWFPRAPFSGRGSAPAVNSAGDKGEGLQRLKQERRIVMETNVPPDKPGTKEASKTESSFKWYFRWEDGMASLGISQKTPIDDRGGIAASLQGTNAARLFHLEELKMNGKIGAKFAVDGAGYVTVDSSRISMRLRVAPGAHLRQRGLPADSASFVPVRVGLHPGSFISRKATFPSRTSSGSAN